MNSPCSLCTAPIDTSSFNRRTNTTRIAWLHWATRWMIASIVTLIVSRSVYYFGAASPAARHGHQGRLEHREFRETMKSGFRPARPQGARAEAG